MGYIKSIEEKVPEYLLEKIRTIEHIALDMDGTIYNGKTLFPFTLDFLKLLKELGVGYSFLTNNPSISTGDYLKKLEALGIEATKEEMYTSAQATIDYLKHHRPELKRLFILGTPSMIEQFEDQGFQSLKDSPEEEPDALVVAFDKSLTYSRLCRAAWWAKEGKPYFATNPDWVCPTDQPVVLVDCGSICAGIEAATGRKPDKVLGKPRPEMLNGILETKKLAPRQIAMVGDRVYTDMKMAHNANALAVLVLSGEATLEEGNKATPKPDLIVPSIKELGGLIRVARQT